MPTARRIVAVIPLCLAVAFGLASIPAHADQQQYGFTVNVTLSPKAAARLAKLKEGVAVAAYYGGEPVPARMKEGGESGEISLDTETITLSSTGGPAAITGRHVDTSRLSWIKGGVAQVLINVFSARRSSPDNLLDCGIFEGSVAKARSAPIKIACKLIEED